MHRWPDRADASGSFPASHRPRSSLRLASTGLVYSRDPVAVAAHSATAAGPGALGRPELLGACGPHRPRATASSPRQLCPGPCPTPTPDRALRATSALHSERRGSGRQGQAAPCHLEPLSWARRPDDASGSLKGVGEYLASFQGDRRGRGRESRFKSTLEFAPSWQGNGLLW